MSKPSQPLVARGIAQVDSLIGPHLQQAMQSEVVGLGIAISVRIRRGLEARTERMSRRALHALNLPSGSDVRRLLAQMAMVERELRELGKTVADPKPSAADQVDDGA